MPEFVIEKRNIPVLTIASNTPDAGGATGGSGSGENALGFRITGGADFEMPITVFQVKENSPAAKAGLNLGDQIVTINGADASAMRLATAESVIKQAGEQLQLVVTKDDEEAAKLSNKPRETHEIKFANDEDNRDEVTNPPAPKIKSNEGRASSSPFPHSPTRSETRSPKYTPEPALTRSPSCESCEYSNAAVVEEQLRQMQKQLNEISIIPMQIQATLSYLTKALAKFAPPELHRELPLSLRSSSVRETIPEECESMDESEQDDDDAQEWDEDDEEFLAPIFGRLFDESEVLEVIPPRELGDDVDRREDGPDQDEDAEANEEEKMKQEKLERVIKMERSWPWSQTAKPIHKRSNCHLVPSVALEKAKIKQLTEGDLSFYNRGYRQRIGN
ncbi:PDZ and LIM domain protein 2 isoform X2 [Armigeres subalbatus]|uniref:PDZ and LIM domain protein 2 isoform X2 n=1 Tax=Armigeres subalbatus TaxID=124917 RepID=UPI002ED3F57C